MKVTKVSVYQADIDLAKGGFHMSGGRSFLTLDTTVVRLDTDAGISGYGEICPNGTSYDAGFATGVRTGLQVLGPKLIGLNPLELEHVNQVIDRELVDHPHTKSPVDMACWDILGKYSKLPVYTLMGGRIQDTVMTYCIACKAEEEENCQEATASKAAGFTSFQLKLTGPRDTYAQRMRTFRQAVGDDVTIMADANMDLLCDEAIQLARTTADLNYVFEQPCRGIKHCRDVRRQAGVPMLLDESMVDLHAILQAHEDSAVDIVKLKLGRLGGLTRVKQARDLCVKLGLPMVIEDTWGTELVSSAIASLGHSTPEKYLRGILNFNPLNITVLADHQLATDGPRVSLSDRPGLGVNPDLSKLGEPVFVIS